VLVERLAGGHDVDDDVVACIPCLSDETGVGAERRERIVDGQPSLLSAAALRVSALAALALERLDPRLELEQPLCGFDEAIGGRRGSLERASPLKDDSDVVRGAMKLSLGLVDGGRMPPRPDGLGEVWGKCATLASGSDRLSGGRKPR
jgi:hypothetical protein